MKHLPILIPLYLFTIAFLWLPPAANACTPSSATITGPTFCEDGVEPAAPTLYIGDTSPGSTCGGTESHVWTLTGGEFVDQNNNPIAQFNGQSVLKVTEGDCAPGDPPCIPLITRTFPTDEVLVRWDPTAPVHILELEVDWGNTLCDNTTTTIVNRQPVAAESIGMSSSGCTPTRTFRANMPANTCGSPSSFNWSINGSPTNLSSSSTLTFAISGSTSTTVSVQAVYGNVVTPAVSRTVPPFEYQDPPTISGPSTISTTGNYFFSLSGGSGAETWFLSNGNDVATITPSASGLSATVNVNQFIQGRTFTVLARAPLCGGQATVWKVVTMSTTSGLANKDLGYRTSSGNASPVVGQSVAGDVLKDLSPSVERKSFVATVRPNPVNEWQIFRVDNLPKKFRLDLTDMNGVPVKSITGEGDSSQIQLDGVASGIYFIKVTNLEDASSEVLKLAVQ